MAEPTTTQQRHAWAVTHEQEEPVIDANGQPTTLHHVHFQTNTGRKSSVAVPDTEYTAQNVATKIHAKAQHINTVAGMNSTNAPQE